ncbi:hypothetical protein Tco_0835665, partial [Tanacetum coccineum]
MATSDPSGSNNDDSINNLDPGNSLHVPNSDNSSFVLIPFKLQETSDKVDVSIVCNLLQKINTIKQGGRSVADYYHRLNSLWREFDALNKFLKCTCEPVRSAFLTKDPLPDVKVAYNIVSRKESHRGIPESSGVSKTKMNATSFAVKSFDNNKRYFNNNNNTRGSVSYGNNSNSNRGPNLNLKCKNYGNIGHTVDRCYEIITFPSRLKKFSNNAKHSFNANVDVKCDKQTLVSPSSPGFTPEQMKLLSLINDSGSGNFHANMDLTRKRTLRTGSQSGGLYLFDTPLKDSLVKSNLVMSFHVSKLLWHNRLGHYADQVLATLYNDLNISRSTYVHVCE